MQVTYSKNKAMYWGIKYIIIGFQTCKHVLCLVVLCLEVS